MWVFFRIMGKSNWIVKEIHMGGSSGIVDFTGEEGCMMMKGK